MFDTLIDAVRGAARYLERKAGSPGRGENSMGTLGGQTSEERQRRTRLLQALYRARVVEVAGDKGELIYSQSFPPDWWINEKLASMGEIWRIQNIDGFRCEVYDLAKASQLTGQ